VGVPVQRWWPYPHPALSCALMPRWPSYPHPALRATLLPPGEGTAASPSPAGRGVGV